MVRHVAFNNRKLLSSVQPRRCVINRFKKTEMPIGVYLLQTHHVGECLARVHIERQHRGIRRDDRLTNKAGFEPETRDPECLVLVVHMDVKSVIARFGNPPRHTALFSVVLLHIHHRLIRFPKQCIVVAFHNDERHQVFKHRAAPREQHTAFSRNGERARKPEPVLFRNVPLRDGNEARLTCFRSQQIVIRIA